MGCDCGKPKCDGHCGVSPAVLQINNPGGCTLFHRVEVPASMGDSVTNPPKPGAYKNVLLYYKADGEAFLYSSDGIPTKVTGIVSDYACLENKPQINGVTLEGDKSLEALGITDAIDDALEDYTPTSEFAEVAFTGDYDDLTGTPTIPTVNNATLTITQNGTSAGTFTANAPSDTTINLTDTTYLAFSGATPSAAGASGLVPAPAAGDGGKALKGDGTWGIVGNVVELFIEDDPDSLPSSFEIYKDSGRTTPITWTELRNLFTPSNEKTVVLHSTTAGDGVYPVVTYYYNTTEFNIFDAYSNATYYIHGASGASPTGFTVEQTDLQERLTAGTGISITDGVISATNSVSVVQTTGQSTTAVMSQKAVTDVIGDVETILQTLNSGTGAQQ